MVHSERIDGWDGMVIIGHRSSKSTFAANKHGFSTIFQEGNIFVARPMYKLEPFEKHFLVYIYKGRDDDHSPFTLRSSWRRSPLLTFSAALLDEVFLKEISSLAK